MLRSISFSGADRASGASTPIQKLWRYLSATELTGYMSENSLPAAQVVDDRHPLGLGNPKILRHIFQHLEARDLIAFRQVNLRWNHIACEFLRRKLGSCRLRPSVLKKFLRLMKRCFCNPFGSYAIRIDNLGDLQTRNFFKRFSQDVINLRVKIESDEIPEFFNRVLKSLPNLEELHLIRIPEGAFYLRTKYLAPQAWAFGVFYFPKLKEIIFESDDPSIPFHRNYDTILVEVINSAPNLVKVGFREWDSHFSRVISRCGISNPKSFDGWKSLSTTDPENMKRDLIELFYDHRMKFKALKFDIDEFNSGISFELAMDLTLQTADSLYHLSLKNDDDEAVFECSMKLPRLITLSLQGWRGPVEFSGMRNQFPLLQLLKVNASNFLGLTQETVISTVVSLTVMPLDGLESIPVDETLMSKLTKMFPSVKQLYVQVEGKEALHVVYESWAKLSLLWVDIRGKGCDEAFTGIPDDVIQIDGQDECGCNLIKIPGGVTRKTCIEKLQDLRILIIRAKGLTETSLLEGISKLENLQTLWFLPAFEVEVEQCGNGYRESSSDDDTSLNGTSRIRFQPMSKPWCLRIIANCFKNLKHLVTPSEDIYSTEDLQYLKRMLPDLIHEFKM